MTRYLLGGGLALVSLALPLATGSHAQSPRVVFVLSSSVPLGTAQPFDAVAADFTRDGHPDLVVTPYTSLLAGGGDGSLAEVQRVSFADASGVAAADFTGDGSLDLAITQATKGFGSNYGDPCGSLPSVAIFAQPTMGLQNCLFAGFGPVSPQSADFDGDGTKDLAVVSRQAQGLRILKGGGDGTFVPVAANGANGIVADSSVSTVRLAPPVDLDNDGRLDLAIAYGSGLRIFLGHGDGTFHWSADISGAQAKALAVADLNGDLTPDIASVDALGRLFAHYGSAGGIFSTAMVATIGTDLTDVAIADLDRDGLRDIIVAHGSQKTMRVFYGSVAGTFDTEAVTLSFRPKLLAVSDWDADGDADVAIVEAPLSGQSAHVWMALSDGTAIDQLPPSVALTSPRTGSRIAGIVAITASASDNRSVKKVEFYANDTLIGTSAGPAFSLAWDSRTWPDGRVQLKTRAFDAAMNQAQSTRVVVTIANHSRSSIDVVAPIVNVGGSIVLEAAGPDGAIVNFTGTASDNIDGSLPITCLPASGASFSLQSSQVTCSAIDSSGNTGWGSFTVVVVDTTPPWITTSANMTVEATSAGAVVNYFASAVDLVSGITVPNCMPGNGTIFPVGTTTVTCTAVDGADNTASRSFNVTVREAAKAIRHAPRAQSAHYTMRAGSVLSARLHARDHDGGALTFWVVSNPAWGKLQLLSPATGAFTFTPPAAATGHVTFSYQVSDGRLLSRVASVTIEIGKRERERKPER